MGVGGGTVGAHSVVYAVVVLLRLLERQVHRIAALTRVPFRDAEAIQQE